MPSTIYYVQECPTCGRNLQVRVKYLGKNVICQHCGADFEACDPNSATYPPSESSLSLLARVDELIEAAARSGIELGSSTPTTPR